MNASRCFILILAVVFCLSTHGVALAVEIPNRFVLRGVTQVHVLVERLNPEIEKAGLTRQQIKTDVEQKLRLAGMKVISNEEWQKTTYRQWILVNIQTHQLKSKSYVYSIGLSLYENLFSKRLNRYITANIFNVPGGVGYTHRLSDIKDFVRNMVDRFINDWVPENPQ